MTAEIAADQRDHLGAGQIEGGDERMLGVETARDDRLVAEPADLEGAAAGDIDLGDGDRGELRVGEVAELDLAAVDVVAGVFGDDGLLDGVAGRMMDGDVEARRAAAG